MRLLAIALLVPVALRPALLALSLVPVALALSGCGSSAPQQATTVTPGQCSKGPMKPVTIAELIGTFRTNQISLRNEHSCPSPPILAEASNMRVASGPRQQQISAREGDVICTIQPRSTGPKVRRAHYQGDAQTYVQTLNVVCAVWPSDNAQAATQIDNVARGLRQLARLHRH
jgi:hypothetical protein